MPALFAWSSPLSAPNHGPISPWAALREDSITTAKAPTPRFTVVSAADPLSARSGGATARSTLQPVASTTPVYVAALTTPRVPEAAHDPVPDIPEDNPEPSLTHWQELLDTPRELQEALGHEAPPDTPSDTPRPNVVRWQELADTLRSQEEEEGEDEARPPEGDTGAPPSLPDAPLPQAPVADASDVAMATSGAPRASAMRKPNPLLMPARPRAAIDLPHPARDSRIEHAHVGPTRRVNTSNVDKLDDCGEQGEAPSRTPPHSVSFKKPSTPLRGVRSLACSRAHSLSLSLSLSFSVPLFLSPAPSGGLHTRVANV